MDRKEIKMKSRRKKHHKRLQKMKLMKLSAWKYHKPGKGKKS